ncbi:MAG: NnrU family protein [Proteobacteria bacterium]|nr:NnrU family protein [Pseudomonadota bacterium]
MEGFDLLAVGLGMFFGVHLISGIHELRTPVTAIMGQAGYRMTHALFAIGGLVLVGMGYADAPFVPLYEPPSWGASITLLVMPVAIIFLIGGHLSKDIKRVTRHPMLWGITLFSALHLLANGDKAAVMIFAPFLVYGLLAMWLTDRKKRLGDAEGWEKDSRQTSVFPFVAMRQGRAGPPAGDKGLKAVLIGLVVYILLAYGHQWLIGVALPIG